MKRSELEQEIKGLTKRGRQYVRDYARRPDQISPWLWLILGLFFPGAYRVLWAISKGLVVADTVLRLMQGVSR